MDVHVVVPAGEWGSGTHRLRAREQRVVPTRAQSVLCTPTQMARHHFPAKTVELRLSEATLQAALHI